MSGRPPRQRESDTWRYFLPQHPDIENDVQRESQNGGPSSEASGSGSRRLHNPAAPKTFQPGDFLNGSDGQNASGNPNVSLPSMHASPTEGTPRVNEAVQMSQHYDPKEEWQNNELDYRPIPAHYRPGWYYCPACKAEKLAEEFANPYGGRMGPSCASCVHHHRSVKAPKGETYIVCGVCRRCLPVSEFAFENKKKKIYYGGCEPCRNGKRSPVDQRVQLVSAVFRDRDWLPANNGAS
ncbi:hypothetical protein F5B22DRAFT_646596 [Xylaria bambusicola]|uniref:uncharacterized protein n=1 Tax=Xylaria bambusicola TaxID=326684 RepID=UPI002008748D|nr:uncharacterized protein F5B22DRAFT_646596 [Xylaria bambusicola]KAI0516862.1 hypothetical protein F5B22DRAFT_646596 [Xylaria bambusicola]